MILLSMLSWLFDDNEGQRGTTILVKEIKECCLLLLLLSGKTFEKKKRKG